MNCVKNICFFIYLLVFGCVVVMIFDSLNSMDLIIHRQGRRLKRKQRCFFVSDAFRVIWAEHGREIRVCALEVF